MILDTRMIFLITFFNVLIMGVGILAAARAYDGHDAGDTALKAISAHMKSVLRSHDVLGRFGGDEFAALLPMTSEKEAWKIAERLSAVVRNTPLLFNHREIRLSISIGVSSADKEHPYFDDLLHRADQSLYSGKKGRMNDVA